MVTLNAVKGAAGNRRGMTSMAVVDRAHEPKCNNDSRSSTAGGGGQVATFTSSATGWSGIALDGWMDGWGGLWCRQERISLYWSLDVCVSMSGRPYAPHILVIDWAWFTYGLNVGFCEEDREWSLMFTECCKKINDFFFFIKESWIHPGL